MIEPGNGQGWLEWYCTRADAHAGFLEHLARHRFLQALARLHEAGQRRIHVASGKRLAMAEQGAVAARAPA